MKVSYRIPPSGPALNDDATQIALRRYRSGAWLLVGAGLVLLGVAVASAVQSLSEPGASLDNLDNYGTLGSLGVGLLLLGSGLISSVNARRWRQILDEHAWQAVRYYYNPYVTPSDPGPEPGGGDVREQLTVLDPADETRLRCVSFNRVWTPWADWRLRPWRQAPRGVAWIAGGRSGALVVTLPGPGRLFGARWGQWAG
jgi:hypothetical protein